MRFKKLESAYLLHFFEMDLSLGVLTQLFDDSGLKRKFRFLLKLGIPSLKVLCKLALYPPNLKYL